ncbi:MAG TPA: hypothetical protein VFJ82_13205 [Longimicrobium sp.]|nr:hypothetical protein [Longimicrobium sp.]
MKKIRLDVTALHVESFVPAAPPADAGTVLGAEASFPATGCIQCQGTQARMTCYDGCPTGADAG